MRYLILGGLVACLLIAPAALAQPSPCNDHAPKTTPLVSHGPTIPAGDRQGGDTFLDAVPIAGIPFAVAGSTCGYANDYDEECPYDGSTAPDVVYSFEPATTVVASVDLFGSSYDTKVYVYDGDLNLVACNDDFYADYVSCIRNVEFFARMTYYIVIDGYGDACGQYALELLEFEPCEVICPAGAFIEGEPPITADYTDSFNGGCCGGENGAFQTLPGRENGTQVICGRSGYYTFMGGQTRDTDWFTVTIGASGVIEVSGDADESTYLFELGPMDCNTVGVVQNVVIGRCQEGSLTITGEPFTDVWVWTGPTDFAAPDGSPLYAYDYVLRFEGLAPAQLTGVPDGPLMAPRSLSTVKALFD